MSRASLLSILLTLSKSVSGVIFMNYQKIRVFSDVLLLRSNAMPRLKQQHSSTTIWQLFLKDRLYRLSETTFT